MSTLPKLPRLPASAVIAILQRLGFQVVRQQGSHVVMRSGSRGCVVPLHKPVKVGTLA
jgi:predicted RNA binding protein YcfA (HicA-like mRNA interferase family)